MTWDTLNRARDVLRGNAMDRGDPRAALRVLADPAVDQGELWSAFACMEGECHAALGDHAEAARVLERAAARGTRDHWVYHGLAREYLALGEAAKYAATLRDLHTALGWPESARHGYTFTHDYFSANIPAWTRWFAERITAAPIVCLEIGSWQGGSATWLLDRVVGPRGGWLTCIDTFQGSSEHAAWLGGIGTTLEDLFDRNIARTGHAGQCRKLVGRSQDVLRRLHNEEYDFIYIDGAHEAKYVIQDALLCWPLLREGGYLLFDDAHFTFHDRPAQNTQTAIAAFRTWFADEIEVLSPDEDRQILLRKH